MADFTFGDWKLTPEGKRYFDEINKLADMEVAVGFQSGQDPYEDGTDLVTVVAYNELGTSDIPARPFMKQSWDNHQDELRGICEQALASVASGGSAAKKMGAFGVGLIQKEIVDGTFKPNKPSTIRKKGSDKPLIDTGHMRQSVKYVVRKAGDST